jgi:hypothetical protein
VLLRGDPFVGVLEDDCPSFAKAKALQGTQPKSPENGRLPGMGDQENKRPRWKWDLFGLALTVILSAVSLLKVEVPRFAFLTLLAGCCVLTWVIWDATSRLRGPFRVGIACIVLLISVCVSWQTFLLRRPDKPAVIQPVLTYKVPPKEPGIQPIQPPKQAVSQEVTVVLYNDANDPQFSVDGKPASPARYSSGFATLRLPEGTHIVHAEYSTRTCSATVTVRSGKRARSRQTVV